ncbi:MAG: FAD-dependent oxidoreductase [Chloroflexi bacterium]|nr:FAD-dependent oxidoreductase [Chloroflexota bacterium]
MASLSKLFTPIKIGNMEVRNRIVMSPMTTLYADMKEEITDLALDYYVARAKGGVGLVTVEACTVDRPHNYQFKSLALWDDKFIPRHKELTDALHAHGAKAVPQITHPGPESRAPVLFQTPSVGPSVVKSEQTGEICEELSVEEIGIIVEKYGDAARRAREAGYDGMELHAAHAYMLAGSFLSPHRNKRTDQYGGTIENQVRFVQEVLRNVKAKAGQDFPVTIRISGEELIPDGRSLEDTLRMVPLLVEAGADAFHVSGGAIDKLVTMVEARPEYPLGFNVPAAAAFKKSVDVPIMVVGRIKDPIQAEEILQKNQADRIVMGRGLLADPEWPNKAKTGKLDEIRKCISCLNCFDSQAMMEGLNCAVNGVLGYENVEEYQLKPATKPKNVVIIGGGPAGMEAARVAFIRGHKVSLYDKLPRLGGSAILASTVHPDNEDFINFLITQVKKLGVKVNLKQEMTPDKIMALKPDVVIIALGPSLVATNIPGDEQRHVLSAPDLKAVMAGNMDSPGAKKLPAIIKMGLPLVRPFMSRLVNPSTIRKLTKTWMPVGKQVVVIGGDLAGCELAQFMAERGRKVTLLEKGETVAPEVGPKRLDNLQGFMDRAGVKVMTQVTVKEITKKNVVFETSDGKNQTIEADSVVITGEAEPNMDLYNAMEGRVPEVYAIGDCSAIGLIRKATATAMSVSIKL